MNYAVHTLMYLYYALMALGVNFCPPELITTAQISQMIIGIIVQVAAAKTQCHTKWNIRFGCLMYISYFFLFSKFALDRFVFKTMKRGERAKELAGHGEPPSMRSVFPVTTMVLDKYYSNFKKGMTKSLSFTNAHP